MAHCKVYAQYRFGEEPVLVFDTAKSARHNDTKPAKGLMGKTGTPYDAAESFVKKFRSEVPCNMLIEEDSK